MDVALQPPVSGLQRTPEENNQYKLLFQWASSLIDSKYMDLNNKWARTYSLTWISPVAHSDVLPSAAATREPSTTAAAHGTAVPGAGGARVAGGGAERRAQGYVPRRPVSALPVAYCLVGAVRLGVDFESPLQCQFHLLLTINHPSGNSIPFH
uniref:Uncharacterized protein n=1 Tax=Oryza punctata TaxID=4537 RepID=A0A0E0L8B0_ORYPU